MRNIIKVIICSGMMAFVQSCLVAQTITWKDLNGIPGVTMLRETSDGVLYAVLGTRIYTSSDAGSNWVQPVPVAGTVEELHTNGNQLLVSRTNVGGTYPHQVFTSTNDGSSWTRIFYEAVSRSSGFRQFLLTDSGTVYAFNVVTSVSSMLYRLQSGSFVPIGTQVPVTWVEVNSLGSFTLTPPAISLIDHNNTIYAGDPSDGLYITNDFGTTWTKVLSYPVSTITSGPGNTVIVTADSTQNNFGGVFVSSDHGSTWKNIGMKETQFTSISSDSIGNILASTVQGNYFFDSFDSTWTFVGPVTHSADNVLATHSGVLLSASSADGIFRSTNQGAWWFSNGLRGKDVSSTLTLASGSIIVGTFGERVFISSDAGASWQQMASGVVGDYIYSLASSGSTVYAGTDQGLYESSDDGNQWTQVSMQVVTGAVHAVAVNGNGKVYAGTDFGVYQSTNAGLNWMQSGLANSVVTNLQWNSSGIMYAATATNGIFQSNDSGATWISRGLVRDDIQTIAVNPAGQIFAGVYGGVFYSTNNGTGWAQNSFTTDYVYSLVCHGINQIFAGTYNGVYDSYDDGQTWKQAGLQGSVILSISFDSQDLLLAGVYQGGIFQSAQTVLGVDEGRHNLPASFNLFQNYPNPFNPTTSIEFQIPKFELVSVKIYDLLGNEVATLVNRELSPGSYHVTWNGENAASGVYYCRLVTSTFSDVKKMVLLR